MPTAPSFLRSERAGRIGAATAVAVLEGLIGYALIVGLGVAPVPRPLDRGLVLVGLLPDPPPPPPPPLPPAPRRTAQRTSGAAAPPNLREQATEIALPPPKLVLAPPVVVAAPVAGHGSAPAAGAAPIPGPGSGAGGQGSGTGSGDAGQGDGDGDDGETPPRWQHGRLKASDFPRGGDQPAGAFTLTVRFTVAVTGRVEGCAIEQSSGNRALDATACRLIEQRFRYEPSRDGDGRPVPAQVVEEHSWVFTAEDR